MRTEYQKNEQPFFPADTQEPQPVPIIEDDGELINELPFEADKKELIAELRLFAQNLNLSNIDPRTIELIDSATRLSEDAIFYKELALYGLLFTAAALSLLFTLPATSAERVALILGELVALVYSLKKITAFQNSFPDESNYESERQLALAQVRLTAHAKHMKWPTDERSLGQFTKILFTESQALRKELKIQRRDKKLKAASTQFDNQVDSYLQRLEEGHELRQKNKGRNN